MIRLSLPLSQYFDVFRLEEPRVPQAIDDRLYVVHDDALDRELTAQDETQGSLVIAAGATDGFLAFSFARDHYIQMIAVTVRSNPANLEYVYLVTQAFGQAQQVPIFFAAQANVLTHTTLWIGGVTAVASVPNQLPVALPLFSRRETDYILLARSGAGGAVTIDVRIRRTEAVEGVRIAR